MILGWLVTIKFKEVPRRKIRGFELQAWIEGKFVENGTPETQLLLCNETQSGLSFLYIWWIPDFAIVKVFSDMFLFNSYSINKSNKKSTSSSCPTHPHKQVSPVKERGKFEKWSV